MPSLEKYLNTSKGKIFKKVAAESLKTICMEEVKKKYIKSIEKSMKGSIFMDILEKLLSKKQKVMGLVEEGLLKERN